MKEVTKRSILRWIHIIFALPLLGFIYGPQVEVQPYLPYFRYIYLPLVALSGLLMWKGYLITNLFRK